LVAHWSVRQIPNPVGSVQLRRCVGGAENASTENANTENANTCL